MKKPVFRYGEDGTPEEILARINANTKDLLKRIRAMQALLGEAEQSARQIEKDITGVKQLTMFRDDDGKEG